MTPMPESLVRVRDELVDRYLAHADDIDGCEYDAYRAGFSACYYVLAESRPPTFIKLDETTEAFTQTHAAIENMKMFQRDNLLLQRRIADLEERLRKAEGDVAKWKYRTDPRNHSEQDKCNTCGQVLL